MIKIEKFSDGIEDEVNRLANGLSLEDIAEFERVLTEQFRATQAAVHVITRSLKSSGKLSSDAGQTYWEGEISYGGPSQGIHNPVDYAEYERERGLNHDFLRPAEALGHEYIAAMNKFLGG